MTNTGSGITAGAKIGAAGTYTVPAAAELGPGLHKIVYVLSNPVMIAAVKFVVNLESKWDSVVIPAIESSAASKGIKLSMPRGNWMNKKTGVAGKVAFPGLTYLKRKDWNEKTRTFTIWVVIR